MHNMISGHKQFYEGTKGQEAHTCATGYETDAVLRGTKGQEAH